MAEDTFRQNVMKPKTLNSYYSFFVVVVFFKAIWILYSLRYNFIMLECRVSLLPQAEALNRK